MASAPEEDVLDVVVSVVNPNDVLCGRGRCVVKHPGNRAFRFLVRELAEEYAASNPTERSQILCELITHVEQNGGRFLKRNNAERIWCIVPPANARWKIAQAFEDVLCRLRLQDHGIIKNSGAHDTIVQIDTRKSKNPPPSTDATSLL